MTIKMKMLQAAAGVGGSLDIADAFSTDLYTGNAASRSITNGVDLASEGGMVWHKSRSAGFTHYVHDTNRGAGNYLSTNTTNIEYNSATTITSFNTDGYTVGSSTPMNGSGANIVSWTFRKAPKFFDVVTYTGNGAGDRTFSHNLEVDPGLVLIKRTDASGDWIASHRGANGGYYGAGAGGNPAYALLNSSAALVTWTASGAAALVAGATTFRILNAGTGASLLTNISGATYVAYLFAHDTEDDSVIKCGVYTGNGSATGPVITLGWEPQWLMVKRSNNSGGWHIYDNQRSSTNPRDDILTANASDSEGANLSVYSVDFNSTSFQLKGTNSDINATGGTYVYMAIRAEA
jgi:hypothetical protein